MTNENELSDNQKTLGELIQEHLIRIKARPNWPEILNLFTEFPKYPIADDWPNKLRTFYGRATSAEYGLASVEAIALISQHVSVQGLSAHGVIEILRPSFLKADLLEIADGLFPLKKTDVKEKFELCRDILISRNTREFRFPVVKPGVDTTRVYKLPLYQFDVLVQLLEARRPLSTYQLHERIGEKLDPVTGLDFAMTEILKAIKVLKNRRIRISTVGGYSYLGYGRDPRRGDMQRHQPNRNKNEPWANC